jgi:hypothetical protein
MMEGKDEMAEAADEMVRRHKKTKAKASDTSFLSFTKAAEEIAEALNVCNEMAEMTLYGLCATGNIRSFNDQREPIDFDECTIDAFGRGPPANVAADDVKDTLAEWSPGPQSSTMRDIAIAAKLRAGMKPGRGVSWKVFCDEIRNECNGWLDERKTKAAWSFENKTIQRKVKDLRQL